MPVKQAAQVLDLFEFLAQRQRPATLAEIASELQWPRSSAFNLLGTLAQRGYLYEPVARAGYYLTPRWLQQAQHGARHQPVPQAVHELLQRAASETLETAWVCAPIGLNAVVLEAIESPHAIRYTGAAGKVLPLHATASGRALLSMYSSREREALLARVHFERYAANTLMSARAVEEEIRRCVERGWFQSESEYTQDLSGVTVALPLADRQLSLTVAGPTFRIGDRRPAIARKLMRWRDEAVAKAKAKAKTTGASISGTPSAPPPAPS